MIYGYARVSTIGQARDGNSLELQAIALTHAGAVRIYSDVCSGKAKHRPELDKLLKRILPGDTLVVTKLDRMARSLLQGIQLIEDLTEKGITVEVLNIGRIDDSLTGRLIRNIMLAFSEFEHDMVVQTLKEGREAARKKPDYQEGRPKKFTHKQISHALDLLKEHSYREVSAMTGISLSTLVRAHKATITGKD